MPEASDTCETDQYSHETHPGCDRLAISSKSDVRCHPRRRRRCRDCVIDSCNTARSPLGFNATNTIDVASAEGTSRPLRFGPRGPRQYRPPPVFGCAANSIASIIGALLNTSQYVLELLVLRMREGCSRRHHDDFRLISSKTRKHRKANTAGDIYTSRYEQTIVSRSKEHSNDLIAGIDTVR